MPFDDQSKEYLISAAGASAALGKALGKQGGADKQIEGANKIIARRSPNDEYALMTLADNPIAKNRADQAYTYAARLVTVMKSKAKPSGLFRRRLETAVKSTFLLPGLVDDAGVAGLHAEYLERL